MKGVNTTCAFFQKNLNLSCIILNNNQTLFKSLVVFTQQVFESIFDYFSILRMKRLNCTKRELFIWYFFFCTKLRLYLLKKYLKANVPSCDAVILRCYIFPRTHLKEWSGKTFFERNTSAFSVSLLIIWPDFTFLNLFTCFQPEVPWFLSHSLLESMKLDISRHGLMKSDLSQNTFRKMLHHRHIWF